MVTPKTHEKSPDVLLLTAALRLSGTALLGRRGIQRSLFHGQPTSFTPLWYRLRASPAPTILNPPG